MGSNKGRALAMALVVVSLCCHAFTQSKGPTDRKASEQGEASVARGKYIVEDVAMCGLCHTPHDSAVGSSQSQWLQGAPVWLKPAQPVENWPLQAPRLAGTPPGTDDEMVKLLTTGVWRDGKPLRLPMPQFRLSRQDAMSVVSYLKSLSSTQH